MSAPSEHKMAQLFASGRKGGDLAKKMEEYADAMVEEEREFLAEKLTEGFPIVFGDEDEEKMTKFLLRIRNNISEIEPHSKQMKLLGMIDELEKFLQGIVVCQGEAVQWKDELLKEL